MKPTQAILAEILDEVRPLIGQGKVADYIPALARVSSLLGRIIKPFSRRCKFRLNRARLSFALVLLS